MDVGRSSIAALQKLQSYTHSPTLNYIMGRVISLYYISVKAFYIHLINCQTNTRNYKPICLNFLKINLAVMEKMFNILTNDYMACTPPTCKLFFRHFLFIAFMSPADLSIWFI